MRPIMLLLPSLWALAWCGTASATSLKITVVSAKLDAARIGSPGPARPSAYMSDLACLSLPGLRALAGVCDGSARGPVYPIDAYVRLEIGDQVIRTYQVPGTLTPRWEYSAIVERAALDTGDSVSFMIYDYDARGAEKKLGDKLVKARELLKPGTRTLKGVGAAEITYRVEVLPQSAPARHYRFRVPADRQMADLARAAKSDGPGYVVVPVAEGEVVEVAASGTVQPNAKKHPDRVAGPDGIPTIQTKIQFNQPGFRGCAGCDHAALIGQIGSYGQVIGRQKRFTVEHAGLLVLAINDLKVSDNAGGFDVEVTVSLPAASAQPKKKGSAADSGPSAISARVVQQTVDAHGDELDACAVNEPNPYGEVVLQFSISADGTPLGVIVEKASPNLKVAGECMRKKALRWRFPPPRGVVTARYPLSFSAG